MKKNDWIDENVIIDFKLPKSMLNLYRRNIARK